MLAVLVARLAESAGWTMWKAFVFGIGVAVANEALFQFREKK